MAFMQTDLVILLVMFQIIGSISLLTTKQNLTESIDALNATIVKIDNSLRLNLKWKPHLKNGTNVDVIVNSKGENCPGRPCSEYEIPGNIREITLPRDTDQFIEHNQCVIEPGCSFLVRVTTTNLKIQTNITVTIPGDCYQDVCSCKHSKELPIPILSADIMQQESLNISWILPTMKADLVKRNISLISVFLSVSQANTPSLSWGGKQNTIYSHFYPLNSTAYDQNRSSRHHFTLATKVVLGSYYIILAHVIDERGCKGRDTVHTVPARIAANESRQATESSKLQIVTLIIPVAIAAVIVLCLCNYVYKHTCRIKPLSNWQSIYRNPPSNGINQISMEDNFLYMDKDILDAQEKGKADIFEVPHCCLLIGEEIGKGAFGRVFKATAHNLLRAPGTVTVAVKRLKRRTTTDELEDFLGEIQTMKDVGRHENIVALLGCCTIKEPLMMIMEYVGHGDLLQYLRIVREKHLELFRIPSNGNEESPAPGMNTQPPRGKYLELKLSSSSMSSDSSYMRPSDTAPSILRPSVTETMYTMLSQSSIEVDEPILEYALDNNELHNFAFQISKGMCHLEKRGITHRDLAARNILIDSRKTLKISDFGLSRPGVYVNTKTKKLPLRWLSIESIRDNLYSSRSDVWAFAVVLWEIGTLGGFPYPTVNNHEILEYLTQGKRLERPEICSGILYKLMRQCWNEDPDSRPTFAEIEKLLQPQNQKIYVDFSTLGLDYVFPPTREQVLENKNHSTNIEGGGS